MSRLSRSPRPPGILLLVIVLCGRPLLALAAAVRVRGRRRRRGRGRRRGGARPAPRWAWGRHPSFPLQLVTTGTIWSHLVTPWICLALLTIRQKYQNLASSNWLRFSHSSQITTTFSKRRNFCFRKHWLACLFKIRFAKFRTVKSDKKLTKFI